MMRISGERTKLQVAHFKLSHSRAFILRAYPLQTHEMLFDAHQHAFRVLGGVPQRGIYDNMKIRPAQLASATCTHSAFQPNVNAVAVSLATAREVDFFKRTIDANFVELHLLA